MDQIIKTIPYNIKLADSFFKRFKGLMFRNTQLENEGLWIIPCNSIHMCFMNFEIDAVFLNNENRIVKMIEGMKPWQFVKPVKGAYSVIELPSGTVARFELKQGEVINLLT
ncbi:DUF192 domain-containing protein [Bacillus sp. FJAT-29814]|uniref:DUF192 domain-containing protein n=1 Tax=Bacillus sp. FJAT-29814 TaxID=1729688 RepID=UPI0008355CF8|nr:DUF192 domain-containing protein [Bacillus sp. FJAT-29814]